MNQGHEPVMAAMKFGRARMMLVLRHQEVSREFYSHQIQLAAVAATQLLFYLFTEAEIGRAFFLGLALLCITTGEREARRMRACGRYHQCKRSLEVVGI